MRLRLFTLFFLLSFTVLGSTPDQKFEELAQKFIPEYQALKVPLIQTAYIDNLKLIQSLEGIHAQKKVVTKYYKLLKQIDPKDLKKSLRVQYAELEYELGLDQERLGLEEDFKRNEPASISDKGLFHLKNGRRWYRYFLKKWTTTTPSSVELMRFGRQEVAKVRKAMSTIQKKLGYEGKDKEFYAHLNSEAFIIRDEKKLVEDFKALRAHIRSNLDRQFEVTDIPEVDIKPIPNVTKDSPPGYYDGNTFFFNFYQNKFAKRALEWLFIHEAIPGHHYQGSLAAQSSPLNQLFWHSGFAEGWAVYTEDIGKDVLAYQDPYMEYGKWEWDLIRSSRIVLDVGLNYYGWSKERAERFWNENIPNQDDLREREINRVVRWPLQVLTYKLGEKKFLDLKEKAMQDLGLDEKEFHTTILQYGDLPLPVLNSLFG